jgi:predicted DNA-binding transcriptional regulator AlpA
LYPRDAAKILSVSISWLAKARLSGDGPSFVKIGRAVRYPLSSLREYIEGRTRGSTSEEQTRLPTSKERTPGEPRKEPQSTSEQ